MRIVIIGNSSGIGKMIEDRLTASGHIVIGFSRSSQIPCDVVEYEQVSDCARYVLDTYDGADALIICAGTQGEVGKITKTDPESWTKTVRVNLDGTYNCIRAFYPIMDQSNRSKIICFAGGGAANGRPFFSAYAASKAAVVRLVETFAMEELTVDINAIAPGAIKTNILKGPILAGKDVIGENEYNKALKQNECGDDPTNMLELVDWLLSNESDGVSGNFISAIWDDWKNIKNKGSELYKLRRTVP